MDIYGQIVACFLSIPGVSMWEEMQILFRRIAAGKPDHWMLPLRACEAVGGTCEQAIPAAVAIACAHIGIILVDDMLDSDPRGEFRRIGAPAASNLACAFQSASLGAVALTDAQPEARLAALNRLNAMFFTTALGQFWDTQSPADETAYWRVVQTKSSPFFWRGPVYWRAGGRRIH